MTQRIVVIGAGPGGYVAAVRAGQLGAEVTVIEKDNVGGTCLNRGCIPSKVLKATADMFDHFRRAAEFGIQIPNPFRLDMKRLAIRKETVIKNQAQGILKLFKKHGIRYVKGDALRFKPGEVIVSSEHGESMEVSWNKLILATGSAPAELAHLPFDGKRILSSNEALFLDELPDSILIIGGGAVGCEFASIFSAFGSRVTLVEAMPRLLPLPSVDGDCSKVLQREMKKRKVKVLLGATVGSVEQDSGKLRVIIGTTAQQGGESWRIEPDCVLVCIGRKPNILPEGLEEMGVTTDDRGWVIANERMETAAEDVYAIGDMLGPSRIMLAHVASVEGMIAAENAMGKDHKMDYRAAPSVVFTSPEVANVGLTESQALQNGRRARSDTVLFRTVGKAQVMGDIAGEAKIVSSADSGEILGVHIIGARASELIAEATLAMRMNATVAELAETIHAHPTLSEVMLETSLAAIDRPLHA
ncbi:MAG: dihydrolipoyl dehydrogenase [Deltaproteobacteria bacterium]|nr:dihydrolipoyl dehydrogenase [Deltaproteobacteria bacterium]